MTLAFTRVLREQRWCTCRRAANRAARAAGFAAALLCLSPVDAAAQRDAFVAAFVDFHSSLIGTYGDDGPQITAALATMESSLAEWQREIAAAEAALKSRPGSAPGDFAVLYLDAGRREDALRAIDAAIAAEPDRSAFHRLRGLILESLGRQADAIAALEKAWTLDPDDPISAYLLADRRAASGTAGDVGPQVAALLAAFDRTLGAAADRSSAPFMEIALVDDGAADTPIFSPVLYADGLGLIASGKYEAAVARFTEAVARDPLVTEPALRLPSVTEGIEALRERRITDAIPLLEAGVAAAPTSSEARRILGAAYRANGDGRRSVEQLTAALELAPLDERVRVALGRALIDAGRHEDAEKTLRETVERMPVSAEARWALADLYETQGRGLDAIAELEAATSLTVLAGKSQLYWRLADLLHRHQDYEGVVVALGHRARLLPNVPGAHEDVGLAYTRLGRQDQALVELLMTAIIGVEDAEALAAIGQIHLNARRYSRAEHVLQRAVAMQPDLAQARYALGTTLIRLGKAAEGKQHLAEFQRLRSAALETQQRSFDGDALKDATEPAAPEPAK